MGSLHQHCFLSAVTQSEAQKDGIRATFEKRPSVLVRRTSRFGIPTPLTSSNSFTAAMTHQPGQVTIGASPLAMLPAAPVPTRLTADTVLPSSNAPPAEVRTWKQDMHKTERKVP